MNAREEILATLRIARDASQGAAPKDEIPRDYILSTEDAPGSRPVLALFSEMLADYHVDVHEVSWEEVPDTIDRVLAEKGAPSVVVPAGLDETWREAAGRGRDLRIDSVEEPCSKEELDATRAVVTASRTAIAPSGTILIDGEPDQGRRIISLLPDLHVCVVNASTVQPSVPQAVAIMNEHPTRPITWIAGGSATSDIELVRVDGVHGPRTLVVLLVNDR